MTIKTLFTNHGIHRVSIWTDGKTITSFCADGEDLQPLFLSEEVSSDLEDKTLLFLNSNKVHNHNIFSFERSKGVLDTLTDKVRYTGDVLVEGDYRPFSEFWLDSTTVAKSVR